MRILAIMVGKDLRRRMRQPLAYAVALAFPLMFSLLVGLAFGRGEVVPRIHLLVENHDSDGFLGDFLVGALQSDQMAQYFQVEEVGQEGRARMEEGDASALLIIPEAFSASLVDATPTTLQLVRNPAQSILPYAAEEGAAVLAELLSSASRVLRGPLDGLSGLLDEDGPPTDATVAALSISVNQALSRVGDYVFPPVITLETSTLEKPADEPDLDRGSTSVFLIVLPGISVFALFMVGDLAMRDLLEEGTAGTLRRQLAGPHGAGTVVAAKAIYSCVLTGATLAILAVVWWSLSPGGVSIPGFALLSAALVLAVTGLAAFIYGMAANQNQGSVVGTLLYMGMAMIGGSFVQLESMPASLRRFSPLSLFYWGNTGYRDLLWDGGGVADVLTHAGILSAAGVLLLGLGAWRLGGKVLRGAAA